MKPLSAGLTLINVATVTGLILGITGGGLNRTHALIALIVGLAASILAWSQTRWFSKGIEKTSAQARSGEKTAPVSHSGGNRRFWFWVISLLFALTAVRSFCWLIYLDGPSLVMQSPFNAGDLSLHITYIRYFAHGVPLWPENPILSGTLMRYPAGIDLFNALLVLLRCPLFPSLIYMGLIGSAATFYTLYRWGGTFTVAGFLLNGGLFGLKFFQTFHLANYQADHVAWKSIPLTLLVPQRGFLYAFPVGLLLLLHWRRKLFPAEEERLHNLIPFWVEWSLYASMPLFHIHTFMALSFILGVWLVVCPSARRHVGLLFAAAFLPAAGLTWLITGHFGASSILDWAPGWVQANSNFDFPFVKFWLLNFGLTLPALIALVLLVGKKATGHRPLSQPVSTEVFAFVLPAALLFIAAVFIKVAPQGWDNIKLMVWSYLICLPFLWRDLISELQRPLQYVVCFLLFVSGFISLVGGLMDGSPGIRLADRAEIEAVGKATRKLPISACFASFPHYDHPLLLNGRRVALGFPYHAWSQGFDLDQVEQELKSLMLGNPNWRELAHKLHAGYLFWGREEKLAYGTSAQPWRGSTRIVASGSWGTIYDLEAPKRP
jgi:hypothetical protein